MRAIRAWIVWCLYVYPCQYLSDTLMRSCYISSTFAKREATAIIISARSAVNSSGRLDTILLRTLSEAMSIENGLTDEINPLTGDDNSSELELRGRANRLLRPIVNAKT